MVGGFWGGAGAGMDGKRCGDQNGDDQVNVLDVVIDMQISAELLEPSAEQRELSDLNQDGVVNVFDGIMGLQHIVGLREITDCGVAASG